MSYLPSPTYDEGSPQYLGRVTDPSTTGVRSRTRRAILDAAAAAWARDFGTSLGDIAEGAEVSRSTLHRYFPERQDLVDGLLSDSLAQLAVLDQCAVPAGGGVVDVLVGTLHQLVALGDRVMFLFADPTRFQGNPLWDGPDDSMVPQIEEAQREGGLAADLEAVWVQATFYALVYTAAELASLGTLPRHVAADRAVRTFLGGCGAH